MNNLIAYLGRLPNTLVRISPFAYDSDMSSDEEEALPNPYTYRNQSGAVTVNAVMDLQHPSHADQNFLSLAHEAFHALHFSRPATTLGQVEPFISDSLDRLITRQVDQVPSSDMLSHSNEWFNIFDNNANLLNRLKTASKVELAHVKLDLISEEVAYRKTSYLARLPRSRDNEIKTANGYKAAINWINAEIERKS